MQGKSERGREGEGGEGRSDCTLDEGGVENRERSRTEREEDDYSGSSMPKS